MKHSLQARDQRPLEVARVRGLVPELGDEPLHALFEQRPEEVLFLVEMVVDRARGHAGVLRDLLDGGRPDAANREDLQCRLKKLATCPFLLAQARWLQMQRPLEQGR